MTGMVYTPGIGWHDPQPRNHHPSVVFVPRGEVRSVSLHVTTDEQGLNPAFIRIPRS